MLSRYEQYVHSNIIKKHWLNIKTTSKVIPVWNFNLIKNILSLRSYGAWWLSLSPKLSLVSAQSAARRSLELGTGGWRQREAAGTARSPRRPGSGPGPGGRESVSRCQCGRWGRRSYSLPDYICEGNQLYAHIRWNE